MPLTLRSVLPFLLSLSAVPSAWSHHVWIEQDAQGARLHFGEFSLNMRETSPGLLDKFAQPTASLVTAKGLRPVAATKAPTAFQLSAKAGTGESLIAFEPNYPAFERKDGERTVRTAWFPAARYVADNAARQPQLALDVVPTGARGEFTVYFKGQVLPKAQVEAVAPSGWTRSLKADEQGRVRVDLPWQGLYALEVQHKDSAGGEREGRRFDVGAYVTTLTVDVREGMSSPPMPPAPSSPDHH